jgi:FMN phosphatase YigB (HAD superfamily)
MRWFQIREAKIDLKLRETLEQYGAPVMQQILSVGSNFRHDGKALWVEAVRDDVLKWLTEQYDRQERKETWQITMEAAVTIFVLAELVTSLISLWQRR